MPRKPRVEYAGAVYHLMSRGDRGGKIFKDDNDYAIFEATIAELCERSGWRMHSYVLMPNHFHWLVETPEANLVAGMKWFLGAYSQRFNSRHAQRGHVFQGRYKALLVDPLSKNYFEAVSSYIHLNPARAGFLQSSDPDLSAYKRSSYPLFLEVQRKRPNYLFVDRVLGNMGLTDDRNGRIAYEQYMQGRVVALRSKSGRKMHQAVCKEIRYGWCLGGEEFKEKMLAAVGKKLEEYDRLNYSGREKSEHDELEAERMLAKGLREVGIAESALATSAKGDVRKRIIAAAIRFKTMVSDNWLSERLCMGCSSNMSSYIRSVRDSDDKKVHKMYCKLIRNNG